jgi:cyclin-dependent kinase 8/11
VASFFSPLELYVEDDGEDSYSEDSSLSGNEETIQPTPQTPPFIIPKGFQHVSPRDEWTRKPIFDLSKGEIGFIWSIFSIMGTPTNETWPVCTPNSNNDPTHS